MSERRCLVKMAAKTTGCKMLQTAVRQTDACISRTTTQKWLAKNPTDQINDVMVDLSPFESGPVRTRGYLVHVIARVRSLGNTSAQFLLSFVIVKNWNSCQQVGCHFGQTICNVNLATQFPVFRYITTRTFLFQCIEYSASLNTYSH